MLIRTLLTSEEASVTSYPSKASSLGSSELFCRSKETIGALLSMPEADDGLVLHIAPHQSTE